MTHRKIQIASFFVILAVAGWVVWAMLRPYVTILLLGAVFAVLLKPLERALVRKLGRPALAASIVIATVLGCIIVPPALFGRAIVSETLETYRELRSSDDSFPPPDVRERLPDSVVAATDALVQGLRGRLASFAGNAFQAASNVASNVASFFFGLFVFLFTLYYLLRDGDRILQVTADLLPLSRAHENTIFTKLSEAVNGVVKGSLLVALSQGVLATIGFWIFGLPQPLLWGTFATVASLLPTIGTAIATVPAALYLLASGGVLPAAGLAAWSLILVGNVDNLLRPQLVGSKANLHPLWVLLSVIGGIEVFGFMGFLLGPIFAALFVTLVDIYRTDLRGALTR